MSAVRARQRPPSPASEAQPAHQPEQEDRPESGDEKRGAAAGAVREEQEHGAANAGEGGFLPGARGWSGCCTGQGCFSLPGSRPARGRPVVARLVPFSSPQRRLGPQRVKSEGACGMHRALAALAPAPFTPWGPGLRRDDVMLRGAPVRAPAPASLPSPATAGRRRRAGAGRCPEGGCAACLPRGR